MVKKGKSAPILVRPDHEFSQGNVEVRQRHFKDGTNLHWHDYYEMEIITGGSGFYYINGAKFPLTRGSAYLVTPVDFHLIEGEFDIYNIAFNESLISEAVMNMIISLNPAAVVSFEEEEFLLIESALGALNSEYQKNEVLRDYALKALLDFILIRYLRKVGSGEKDQYRSDVAVMRVVSYIKFNFKNKLTLSQAAEAVHLTSNYVGEIFAKKMGVSFNTYLMQTRLNYAKNLLLRGNCTIEEVAFSSGFGSQTYFSDCFRKEFGYTPTSFKRRAAHGLPEDAKEEEETGKKMEQIPEIRSR